MNLFKIAGWIIFAIHGLGALSSIMDLKKEPERAPYVAGATVINALIMIWIYIAITR